MLVRPLTNLAFATTTTGTSGCCRRQLPLLLSLSQHHVVSTGSPSAGQQRRQQQPIKNGHAALFYSTCLISKSSSSTSSSTSCLLQEVPKHTNNNNNRSMHGLLSSLLLSQQPPQQQRQQHHQQSYNRMFHGSGRTTAKMTVEQLANVVNLDKQNVLVRVDLNVPLSKTDDFTVTDDTRLRAILPTVRFLLSKNANVILCSHFGRPKGEVIETGKNGRLNPVVKPLEAILGVPIIKVNDCIGPDVELVASALKGGQVMLLENTRFHIGETKNDNDLALGLSKLAQYFVMDAFGTAHRAHSSTAGVCQYMKYNVAGSLMEKELQFLQDAVDTNPQRPLMAIVGGAKVSTKLPVIQSLINKCDTILIGGGMIFTFYKAMGYNIGNSLVEDEMIDLAKALMKQAKEKNVQLLLPTDVVVADKFDNNANTAIASVEEIQDGWIGLDIGPDTIVRFGEEIGKARTIVWNGPMGVFEMSNFATGTNEIAKLLADATEQRGAITIVGGGDSVAAINQAGLASSVSHISTGGGASLELLEGKILPGVQALTEV